MVRAQPKHVIIIAIYHLSGIYNNLDGCDSVIIKMSVMGTRLNINYSEQKTVSSTMYHH